MVSEPLGKSFGAIRRIRLRPYFDETPTVPSPPDLVYRNSVDQSTDISAHLDNYVQQMNHKNGLPYIQHQEFGENPEQLEPFSDTMINSVLSGQSVGESIETSFRK